MEYFKLVRKRDGFLADVRCSSEDSFPERLYEYFTEEPMTLEEYTAHKSEINDFAYFLEKAANGQMTADVVAFFSDLKEKVKEVESANEIGGKNLK